MASPSTPLRFGILGAARIAPMALVRPAREVSDATVLAVAARRPQRAFAWAARHHVPRVHETYEKLLGDPEIDCVYVPLPNALHCEWSLRALEAGKHVLCEKPLASNATEAARMQGASEKAGLVLAEAFHYRHHKLARRMREIVAGGDLGKVLHVEAHMCVPFLVPGNIRFKYELAGGATMDAGCYAVNLVRFLSGAEPEVVRAEARLASPYVDRAMQADLRFEDGSTGRITCSLLSARLLRISARVRGEKGEMRVFNPIAPQFYHRLTVVRGGRRTRERVRGEATYTGQLRAFARAVRGEEKFPTGAADSVLNMRVIDSIYEKAGLPRRAT